MFSLLIALVATPALAWDVANGGVSATGGVGMYTHSDSDPSLRLGIAGEFALIAGDNAVVSLMVPLELDRTSASGFGITATRLAFELPISLRVGVIPAALVRPVLDVGFGPTIVNGAVSSAIGSGSDTAVGWVARAAAGLQLGDQEPGSLFFVVEPLGWRFSGVDGENYHQYVAQAGVGVRF